MREYLRYSLALLCLIFYGTLSAQNWVCQADFSYSQAGNTVTFTDNSITSAPIQNWFWDFGDGNNSTAANATHTYAQAGIYGPCLSIFTADSCYTIHCDTVVVQGGGGSSCQAAFTVAPISASGFQFSNASTATAAITSYLWDFGDGSYSNLANPNHAYTSAGTYSICLSLTTADNCTSTYCDSVTASTGCGTCHAEFTYSQNGPIVNFTDVSVASSTIISWYWDYGDGSFSYGQNPSHSYALAGYYNVCLSIVTQDSCVSTWCDSIYTQCGNTPTCQANFTATPDSNLPGGFQFNDQSTASGPIIGWSWSFGDGGLSGQQNPNHVYGQSGSYLACLTIYTADSCSSTFCDTVVVNIPCNCGPANFSYTVSGNTVTFNNTSSGCYSYSGWTFGNGSTSTQTNPVYTYSGPGTYPVCLCIYDANNNLCDIICQNVQIGSGCQANAAFTYTISGNTVSFNNQSSGAPLYQWWFGTQNGSSSAANPVYTYPGPGTYSVCLTAYDSSWTCYDSICTSITIPSQVSCQANFYAIPDSNNQGGFQFIDQSTGSSPILGWYWSFGDGSTSTQQNPNHVYGQAGSYIACLSIYTADSCFSTWCDTVVVVNPCNCGPANFSYTVSGNTVTFNNTSSGCYSYSGWTFGNGGTSSQTNPVYTYSGPGTYPVCLCIYDANNNLCDIICQNVQIGSGCNINAAFTYQVSGNTVYFQNQSTGNIAYYDWIFGNFQSSSQVNPTHTFPGPGSYNVCLLAWDSSFSCADTLCQTITINGCQANAAFTYTVSGNTVSFNNQSSGAPYYQWWFGTQSSSSAATNPVFTYPGPGTYTVCLTAYDSTWVCYDSICTTVTVGSSPCSANAAFTWTRSGNTVNFQHSGPSGPNFYLWYFGDGGSSNQQNPQHTYPGPGTYPITFYVYDSLQGCADTLFTSLTIPTGPRTTGGSVALMWNIVNFPNPTSGVSNLRYELSEETEVTIQVFGLDGRVIEVLVEGETQPAGEHTVKFDATDLPGGIYLYDIRAGDSREGLRFVKE